MRTYLISYDLRFHETSESYKPLIDTLRAFDAWAKPLESVWLVKSDLTSNQIIDTLLQKIDSNDKLLVINVTNDWTVYGLSEEVVKWMRN